MDFSPLESADFVVCTGLIDDAAESPDDYAALLQDIRSRNLDMVCANPDIVVQWGDQLVWCAGALARDYERLGGRTIVSGKPHRPIYDLALQRLSELGATTHPSRILAIGDGPETDLAGATATGLDALFIAGGILGETVAGEGFTEDAVAAALDDYGVATRWAAPSLIW